MEEKEYNVVTLNNGTEYTEIARLNDNNNTYVLLSNLDDTEDFCIKKLIKNNGIEQVVALDSASEFDRLLALFTKDYLS